MVAVPTLAALARARAGAGPGRPPLLDARRGEVYAAGFARRRRTLAARGRRTPRARSRRGSRPAAAWSGEGAALCAEALRGAAPASRIRAAARPETPAAPASAALGAARLARGEARRPRRLVPRYVRRAEAEVKRTGERFEPPYGSAMRLTARRSRAVNGL